MRRAAAALAWLAALAAPAGAAAAPRWVDVGAFAEPVHVAAPPGDPARLFVVERSGRVQLLVGGERAATPFADLTAAVDLDDGERGLLSIAFPPDHATSGRFYLFATAKAGAFPDAEAGDIVILEGRRSAQNANVAAAGFRVLTRIPHPAGNHNGGQLAFGPDGALYAGIGDGGNLGDPADAQDPASLLGKILRFADPAGTAAPTVWASGLRNPWRFSFDPVTGDVLIGDVGSGAREEVDRLPFAEAAAAVANYGWNRCEGDVGDCGWPGATAPLFALSHDDGFVAIIGGVVVRDPAVPSLAGRYVFADLGQGTAYSADPVSGGPRAEGSLHVASPRSWGEDACGRVYLATAGEVQRLAEATDRSDCAPAQTPPPPPPPPPPGSGPQQPPPPAATDTTPPRLSLRRGATRRIGRFTLRVRADEAAEATVRARGYVTRRIDLDAGVGRRVRMQARPRALRRLRGKQRVARTVRLRAADAAGNVARATLTIRLRRAA